MSAPSRSAAAPVAARRTLSGTSLHGGTPVRVDLVRSSGPVVWKQRGACIGRDALAVAATDRGVRVASPDGAIAIESVEHLLAALGGLGIRGGVHIETDDDELPLLDGGASAYAAALSELALDTAEPAIGVAREATLCSGGARYRFAPSGGVRLAVDIHFRPPIGREHASWDGDAADFVARIAPARTFGWLDEHEALLARGRARGADLEAVLVLLDGGVHPGCRPPTPCEAARHKLLDLIGDLAFYGGPPRGVVEAVAPGHRATHAVMMEAIRAGIIVPRAPGEGS